MANSDVLVRMKADTQNYDANIAKARRQLDQFRKDNLSLGGVMKQSTAALTGMAASVLSVTAAIGAAKKVMGDMVRINQQFEQGTAVLASIMGKTTDEIAALTNQAKQLGATTRYTAMQITELQTNLARLGFTDREILNSTKAVQALATATGADLGEAANLAGAALRGFGMNSSEMERATSVLAVSTTKSALSFEKLATAVPIVAPVAKQFGFTIEDTVTLLGKLSDAGMDASTAATATRNIFLKMADGGGKLSQALGRPVHSVEEFGEALKEMREKGMSLNDILKMVGVRSTAAFAVFADNADTLKDFKQSITDCSEAMHDMEDKQINTLQGSVTILNSAWEGLMLTFSESNGTIKTVVDSLAELLQAWTKWRNRNAGGDSAIQTYEMADSEVAKYGKQYLEADRAAGMSDSAIKKNAEAEKAAIEAERDAMKELLAEWEKAGKLGWGSKEAQALMPKVQEKFKVSGNAYKWAEQMQKQIAQKNDNAAIQDYIISSLTAPSAGKVAGAEGEEGGGKDNGKSRLATLKAQYEEQEKAQIASLDRMAMNEADYEAEVYKIKRETLQKIADLYQEETAEKARANAAISQLDIQYQGIQMRLANRGSKSTRTYEQQTGPSGYSMEGVSALRSEIQSGMKSMQMGSKEYMVEASRLVDLSSFENLLKTAVQAGIEIDPTMLEANFEKIDLGVDVSDEEWQTLVDSINTQLKDLGLDPIVLDVKTGNIETAAENLKSQAKGVGEGWNAVASAVNTVGGALQQIEDPGAKIAGIVAQAVANIALSFAEAAASPAVTSTGWGWLGFAAAGIATMISTIASIKSVTAGSYASGGIVPGNSYSGDNLTANVNSGELILNRAQQDSVASQLQGNNPFGNLALSMVLKGEDIQICLDNNRMRRGR